MASVCKKCNSGTSGKRHALECLRRDLFRSSRARPVRERFEEKVDRSAGEDACHPWIGGLSHGKPIFCVTKLVSVSPRRLLWEWTHGEKPYADRRVWVTCENQQCMNPKHHRCETYEERFWSFVDKSAGPDACWPWTGSRLKGYGAFRRYGNRRVATRIAWEYVTGAPPPDDLVIMHSCDNPPCCNPAHLKPGTDAENVADCIAKGRNSRGEKHAASMRARKMKRAS